jgi:hypothetical protein
VGCALKAFCLAFAFVLSIVPAAAAELNSSKAAAQTDETEMGRLYRLAWLRQKIASEAAAEAAADNADPAEAAFAQRVRAMVALARQEVARAAADPNPVQLTVHLHCTAKRVVLRSRPRQPFVPALEWSVADDGAPPTVTTRIMKACAIKLIRTQLVHGQAPHRRQGPQMIPYAVEMAPVEQAAQ